MELCLYILSFDDNEQLMIMVQKMHKVKERARPHLQRHLLNVTWPDKWYHNNYIMTICSRSSNLARTRRGGPGCRSWHWTEFLQCRSCQHQQELGQGQDDEQWQGPERLSFGFVLFAKVKFETFFPPCSAFLQNFLPVSGLTEHWCLQTWHGPAM